MAAEWDWDKNEKAPDELSLGSSYKAYWVCSFCSESWRAEVKGRALKGKGCPACRSRSKPRKFGSDSA